MSDDKTTPGRSGELERRLAVQELKILDTPREERFDRMTKELAEELEAPVAYVAFLDGERQWVKSETGGMEKELPQEQSFCNITIQGDEPLIVDDATEDERFKDLDLVTGEDHQRFYAGVPIQFDGQNVGTVCVTDREVRSLSDDQLAALKEFAGKVEEEISAAPTVFISYAHEDEEWKDRLVTHCEVLEKQGLMDVWVDRHMTTGEDWEAEIRQAIERAKVAVMLVTSEMLTSDFILQEEVPRMLQRRDQEGLLVLPVLLKSCPWESVDWLSSMNLWPRDGRCVASGEEAQIDTDLAELAEQIVSGVKARGAHWDKARESKPAADELPASRTQPAEEETARRSEPANEEPVEPDPKAGDPDSDPSDGPSRVLIGRFEIKEPLGKGASLYRALDTKLGREVTIKLMPPEWMGDEERLERFQREAHLLATLEDPAIATLFELEEAQGTLVMVLQPLRGVTLDEFVERGPMSIDQALQVGREIARALAAAHEQQILHRGLDPSTVVVDDDLGVKLIDFGVGKAVSGDQEAAAMSASMSVASMLENSSPYASPERLRNHPVDARTDVFSFGCVLWLMLKGASPFEGPTPVDTLARIIEHQPDWDALPEETPEAVRDLLESCLAKEPADRPADMRAVEAALAG